MRRLTAAVGMMVLILLINCDSSLLSDLQAKIDADRENIFVSYAFPQTLNPGLAYTAEGAIEEDAVTVLVPVNTDVTSLVAEFDFQGKEVVLGETVQESGLTANDFSQPLTYTVRSQDGSAREYLVTVREASDNAHLSSLTVVRGTAGSYAPYLEPVFDTDTTGYLFWVPDTVTYVTVSAETVDPNASAAVSGTVIGSSGSANVSLVDGPNAVPVLVTAEDGLVTRTYSVNVYRAIGLPQTLASATLRSDDDGALQLGTVWDPATRFIDNGDGTVLDTLTGLIWLENGTTFSQVNAFDWEEALDIIQDMEDGASGLSDGSSKGDWRMPNYNELFSLICMADSNPGMWLDLHEFSNYDASPYPFWTSTTVHGASGSAYAINFGNGESANYSKDTNPGRCITAVRGPVTTAPVKIPRTGQTQSYRIIKQDDDGYFQNGTPFPSQRFIDNEDGTMTDRLTGLVWLRDWDLLSGGTTLNGAMNAAAALEDNGSTLTDGSENGDWRIPNVRELSSIACYAYVGIKPWLESQGFVNIPTSTTTDLWSSTYPGATSSQAFCFDTYYQRLQWEGTGGGNRYTAVRSVE